MINSVRFNAMHQTRPAFSGDKGPRVRLFRRINYDPVQDLGKIPPKQVSEMQQKKHTSKEYVYYLQNPDATLKDGEQAFKDLRQLNMDKMITNLFLLKETR